MEWWAIGLLGTWVFLFGFVSGMNWEARSIRKTLNWFCEGKHTIEVAKDFFHTTNEKDKKFKGYYDEACEAEGVVVPDEGKGDFS